jgi:hypothetical protein
MVINYSSTYDNPKGIFLLFRFFVLFLESSRLTHKPPLSNQIRIFVSITLLNISLFGIDQYTQGARGGAVG